jgi:hypothetical protein
MLGCLITASGYLSDGQHPFQRQMSCEAFVSRMQTVLRRRFGDRAPELAQRQWVLFQNGAFAQQEDWQAGLSFRMTGKSPHAMLACALDIGGTLTDILTLPTR